MSESDSRPRGVVLFERLQYGALALTALSTIAETAPRVLDVPPTDFSILILSQVVFTGIVALAVFIWLIYMTARQRKNWARWILLVFYILSLPGALRPLVSVTASYDDVIRFLVAVISGFAFYKVFTDDAEEWFRTAESVNGD